MCVCVCVCMYVCIYERVCSWLQRDTLTHK